MIASESRQQMLFISFVVAVALVCTAILPTGISAYGLYSYGPASGSQYAQYSMGYPTAYMDPSLDPDSLPVKNIFDPYRQRNVLITTYSFEDLDYVMHHAQFRSMNDISKVCESMSIMYGYIGSACRNVQVVENAIPVTTRAQVGFYLVSPPPQPRPIIPIVPAVVIYVDPVYPPWSPTYNPYW